MPVGPEPAEEGLAVGVLEADAAGVEAALPVGSWPAAAVEAGVAEHMLVVREPGEQGACAGLGGGEPAAKKARVVSLREAGPPPPF